MVCAVTAEFVCRDGLGKELLSLLSEMIPETRKKEGAISIDMCTDQDNPDRIVLIERWNSRANHEAYVAYRKERGDIDTITTMLIAPPKFIWLDLVDV
ncbi:MAG: putative quinol monooxygenase [Rhodospirillales bacterium]|jgi:quinol monooxygenase YgiN